MPARQSRWAFWKFVNKKNTWECWPWTSATSVTGHPRFGAEGVQWYAHRLAYAYRHGKTELPADKVVMHLCNNPACCNPDHLYLGTQADNMKHAGAEGSLSRRGRMNGNCKLTGEQVIAIREDKRPSRLIAKIYGVEKTQILRIRRGIQRA